MNCNIRRLFALILISNHFRLPALPFEAFFLTVCSKPPVHPTDCSGTDLTGTTDWLTEPDDWSSGCIEAVTISILPDKLRYHRTCHWCHSFLRQTIVRKCQKVIGHIVGSRPSDHYFRSVCWFVCLLVCLSVGLSVCLFVQSFSQPSLIWFRSN